MKQVGSIASFLEEKKRIEKMNIEAQKKRAKEKLKQKKSAAQQRSLQLKLQHEQDKKNKLKSSTNISWGSLWLKKKKERMSLPEDFKEKTKTL